MLSINPLGIGLKLYFTWCYFYYIIIWLFSHVNLIDWPSWVTDTASFIQQEEPLNNYSFIHKWFVMLWILLKILKFWKHAILNNYVDYMAFVKVKISNISTAKWYLMTLYKFQLLKEIMLTIWHEIKVVIADILSKCHL